VFISLLLHDLHLGLESVNRILVDLDLLLELGLVGLPGDLRPLGDFICGSFFRSYLLGFFVRHDEGSVIPWLLEVTKAKACVSTGGAG